MMEGREKSLQQLVVKLNTLLEKHKALNQTILQLKQENLHLKEQNALLQQTLSEARGMKVLAISNSDINKTRKQISHIIREIDECIALISV